MFAIFKKEINSFFASPIGYLVIAIFLLLNGLFLWLFKGEFNVLDYGFADLSSFFLLAPWILIFLIPAVCMRSFSDEKKQGTLELLLTKPVSHFQIVFGKYLGALSLILLALLPTLLYVYTVYQLGNPTGNLDMGSTLGSYFGLLFLVMAYTSIGIFASTLSDNQIVAFITAVFLCFFFYIGFEGIGDFTSSTFIEQLGMSSHFKSMGRGVIDTRDLIYFLSITTFFIFLTVKQINNKHKGMKSWLHFLPLPIGLIVLNIFTHGIYKRFDLTTDNRYTLSDAVIEIIEAANAPIIVDVFLKGDDFPAEFRRLQAETKQMLEEFASYNSNIKFSFINPLEDESTRERNIEQLNQRGLTPMQLSVQQSGKTSQEVIFPWALASYGDVTIKIPLVKNTLGATQQELVNNSVQHLEYAFADGFSKLIFPKKRKIAVLKGNGELPDQNIADFISTLKDYYFIAPFTLDSVATVPQKSLDALEEFDMVIAAKPTKAFTEEEKFVLDQYTMNGGKSLWLVDAVAIDKDSLYNDTGTAVAIPMDLNLTDYFFKYGIRVNPVITSSMYSAALTLAMGEGSQAQFKPFPWPYSPLATSEDNHPIVYNTNLVKFDFANQIDTLSKTENVKKTVLLKTAPLTTLEGTPKEISLDVVTQKPDPAKFNKGSQNLAVLLEGQFTSVYNNRIPPLDLNDNKKTSVPTKMIVIADGDVIKNEVGRSGPQELGFDRSTGQVFGNKEFLLNAVNYLLDDTGLINIRSKEVAIAFLDQEKIADQKNKWRLLNIALPLSLLALFGFIFNFLRRKKYAH
ncbi:gliding motility-associated ABC transporter substrate-binding protein GldG [Mangrovimonas aestuarii]|uniref:gliding motility-associated ABC transporter substrate-binding protein GldG n=1 Tax=Mangrovimonas aestuarii TaxID=3018443 RepID=UPI002379B49D|nr:gliding motility-associated ABC transporter substrate-binding protein GldG [Mangrovimonas aestuarii]